MSLLPDGPFGAQAVEALQASEARYRSLFENMLEGLAHCRMLFEEGQPRDFIYLEVNSTFETLTGLKNVVGKRVSEVIPGIRESQPELFAVYGRVALTGKPEKFEIFVEGLKTWFSISVYSTERPCFTAVFENITERKQVAEALLESERRYRVLFNSVNDAVFVHEGNRADGSPLKFVEVNDVACQRLGYTREELLQMGPPEIDAPETLHAIPKLLEKIDAEKSAVWEGVHVTKAGRKIPVEISNRLFHLNGRATYLSTARDITERKKVQAAIQQGQAELEAIYDSTPLMLCLVNRERQVERMNRTMAEFVGAEAASDVLRRPGDLLGCVNALDDPRGCGFGSQCDACPLRLAVVKTFETGESSRQVEAGMFLVRNGVRREIQVSASTALVRLQEQSKVLVCFEDITGRKQLQAQLLQAQKMEAIGQLAGGVAHDFNNILAATLLHLELLQQKPNLDPEMVESLRELEQGTQRAASLTRQLLLFSRRQVMQTKRVDVNEVVEGLIKMLRRLLGEHIDTTFSPSPEPLWLEADPGMLEQVVMNLCVNARDAMPKGGQLDLSVRRLTFAAEAVRHHPEARPGDFACFTATDAGCGMDETMLKRVFEPFFTTKEPGKGTGLGLATVQGIAKQHHGWVEVESAVGRGTTFRVFLPVAEPAAPAETQGNFAGHKGGTETILLVEDDDQVRRMARLTLCRLGYEVLEASDGVEAMRLWERHGLRVSLVFTDMVMPGGVTGLDLVEQMRQLKPDLKVLIFSGYTADLLPQTGRLPAGVRFLAKPSGPDTVAKVVRECLDDDQLQP